MRTILGARPITEKFHEDTARLTAKVALMLEPLTHFFYTLPLANNASGPNLQDQYQALHNIIACAGYLSICIRHSKTILYFTKTLLNDEYNEDDHCSTEAEVYSASKQAVATAYQNDVDIFQTKEIALQSEFDELEKAQKTKAAGRKKTEIEAHHKNRPIPPSRIYAPLAKIIIWPMIKRFEAGGLDDEIHGEKLENRKGMRIFDIAKSAIVTYYGIKDYRHRESRKLSLEEFVEDQLKLLRENNSSSWYKLCLSAVSVAGTTGALFAYISRYTDIDPADLIRDVWDRVNGTRISIEGLVVSEVKNKVV